MGAFTEQQIRERLIREFVGKDPISVALRRPVWGVSAAGGRVQTGSTTLAPQLFYFQPFKRRITVEYVRNPQGYGEEEAINVDFLMIGLPEVNWALRDEFVIAADTAGKSRIDVGIYTILWINPSHWDHRQAGVAWRALQVVP